MIVLLVALTLGQASGDTAQQQREQILANLAADMKAGGTYDAARYEQARQQLARLSADAVAALSGYYADLKRQASGQAMTQALAQRDQAIAVRNQLATTLAIRTSPVFNFPYASSIAYGPASGYPLPYTTPMMYGNAALYSGYGGMYGAGMYGAMGPYSGVGPYGTGLYGGIGPGALPPGFGPAAMPGAMAGFPSTRSTFPAPPIMLLPPH